MTSETSVGLIGVGFIGKRLADSLLDAGHPLTVHDVDESNQAYTTEKGAAAASVPAEVGENADVVLLALPGSFEVESVMEGEDGLHDALGPGDTVIDTTTVRERTATEYAQRCREKGVRFVSAPLTRGAPVEGFLLMVGGPDEDYEAARDVIETVAGDHVRFEDVGSAIRFKYLNQVRYASQLAVDAEVVAFAEESGIDPDRLNDHLGMGIDESLLEHDYEQDMEGLGGLAIWEKDLGYTLEAAGEDDAALPLTSSVHEVYKAGNRLAGENDGAKATIQRYWEALNGE